MYAFGWNSIKNGRIWIKQL
eukprot:Gb_06941 [translate_table: standard]